MFYYSKEQEVLDVCGVKVGGQPGENPTLMLGSIFYPKEEVDYSKAEEMVAKQREMSELTKLPAMVNLMITKEEYVEPHIDFMSKFNEPFSIDSSDSMIRVKAVKYVEEVGLSDMVVFNSLNVGVTDKEVEALRQSSIKSAILLAFNPSDMSVEGRVDMLRNGGGILSEGLIETAKKAGIENLLLDPAVTPFGYGAGDAFKSIMVFKEEFGLPVGCAPHNLAVSWEWLKSWREARPDVFRAVSVGLDVIPVLLGADYLIYGPITKAERIFPIIAAVNIVSSEANDYFGVNPSNNHPRRHL